MRISNLIRTLQRKQEQFGDINVHIGTPENNELFEGVTVIKEKFWKQDDEYIDLNVLLLLSE